MFTIAGSQRALPPPFSQRSSPKYSLVCSFSPPQSWRFCQLHPTANTPITRPVLYLTCYHCLSFISLEIIIHIPCSSRHHINLICVVTQSLRSFSSSNSHTHYLWTFSGYISDFWVSAVFYARAFASLLQLVSWCIIFVPFYLRAWQPSILIFCPLTLFPLLTG